MSDAVGMRLGELEEIIADEDGYTAEANAEELLGGRWHPKRITPPQHGNASPPIFNFVPFCAKPSLAIRKPCFSMNLQTTSTLESIGWLENFFHSYTGTLDCG